MQQILEKIAMTPAAGACAPGDEAEDTGQRPVEWLLLGSVAVFMLVWLALLGWLAWWFLS
jgi:plastocyanin domain-containing protein